MLPGSPVLGEPLPAPENLNPFTQVLQRGLGVDELEQLKRERCPVWAWPAGLAGGHAWLLSSGAWSLLDRAGVWLRATLELAGLRLEGCWLDSRLSRPANGQQRSQAIKKANSGLGLLVNGKQLSTSKQALVNMLPAQKLKRLACCAAPPLAYQARLSPADSSVHTAAGWALKQQHQRRPDGAWGLLRCRLGVPRRHLRAQSSPGRGCAAGARPPVCFAALALTFYIALIQRVNHVEGKKSWVELLLRPHSPTHARYNTTHRSLSIRQDLHA